MNMQFRVKVIDSGRGVSICDVEAADEADVRRQLVAQGRRIIAISSMRKLTIGRAARVPLVGFSQELVALLEAGLSLVEAIDTLTEKEANVSMRRGLEQIRARLFEGRTLSAALEELPGSFPPLYVATVRASERTGDLREALVRFVAYQQQIDTLKKKLVSASIYPLVLCGAGILVTLFLLGYVVPRFSGIYQDLGSELPTASMLLMKWGLMLQAHGMRTLLIAIACVGAMIHLATRPGMRTAVARAVVEIPAIGRHVQTYQLARLYRTIGMLLRGGTPAPAAIKMSEGLLSVGLRPALARALREVQEGRSIADALERNTLTTSVAARMLQVGERSGNMGEMMERIAAFYDEELARTIDILTRLIEPLLMAFIGLLIGFIVVLMYFPIFELAAVLQ
jgi:general secretion pathway protein F